jgi:DNA-binding transcriptional MerR regulator
MVTAGTVGQWRKDGLLTPVMTTPGGQARYLRTDVEKLLQLDQAQLGKVAGE